jgi:hypothetical protein
MRHHRLPPSPVSLGRGGEPYEAEVTDVE